MGIRVFKNLSELSYKASFSTFKSWPQVRALGKRQEFFEVGGREKKWSKSCEIDQFWRKMIKSTAKSIDFDEKNIKNNTKISPAAAELY